MSEHVLVEEIQMRKSITNWSDAKLSQEAWQLLFEAARRAPSSWNHQPARYVAIDEDQAKHRLCDALHRTNSWAKGAAGIVVQFAAPEDDDCVDGKAYYLYDCGLAMMSMVYQAQSMGVTARQMIGWDEAEVKRILNIPNRYRVVVITAFGYPSNSKMSMAAAELKRKVTAQNKRDAIEDLVSWQVWNGGHAR